MGTPGLGEAAGERGTPSGGSRRPQDTGEAADHTWSETKVEWAPDLCNALALNCGFVAAKRCDHAY